MDDEGGGDNAGTISIENLSAGGAEKTLAAQFALYREYGVVYDEKADRATCYGKPVRLLVDFQSGASNANAFELFWHDPDVAAGLSLEVVKDATGKVTGVWTMPEDTARVFLAELDADRGEKAAIPMPYTWDATLYIDDLDITARDIAKEDLDSTAAEWLEKCDRHGTGMFVMDLTGGPTDQHYLYYNGGGRYPWHLTAEEGELQVILYRVPGKTTGEGYQLLRIDAPRGYETIYYYWYDA